jgi:hypothetical protein
MCDVVKRNSHFFALATTTTTTTKKMDRQELERQKLAEVRNLSHHILRWTHKTVGSSDDDSSLSFSVSSAEKSNDSESVYNEDYDAMEQSIIDSGICPSRDAHLESQKGEMGMTNQERLRVIETATTETPKRFYVHRWKLVSFMCSTLLITAIASLVFFYVDYLDYRNAKSMEHIIDVSLSDETTSPLSRPAPVNDRLMAILWKYTAELQDETALGLWQPPLADSSSLFLQGLSPQYQAYLWLERRYPNYQLPSTQQLLEEYALATLYYATNGPNWIQNQYWTSNFHTDNSNICAWYSTADTIACNEHGRFVSLHLDQNGLLGTIPPELALLRDLHVLSLSQNHISGTIPVSLSRMTNLQVFSINFNQLTSTLPPDFQSWTDLKEFSIANNQFTGSFPSYHYRSWRSIQTIHLESNHLTGTVKRDFCRLAHERCTTSGASFSFQSDCFSTIECTCCTCCSVERGLCLQNGTDDGQFIHNRRHTDSHTHPLNISHRSKSMDRCLSKLISNRLCYSLLHVPFRHLVEQRTI